MRPPATTATDLTPQAATQSARPAHTYFVERYERERAQFAEGFHDESTRSRLREGVSSESAASLFHAALNGLRLHRVLDQDLDIAGPVTDFVRLLFDHGRADD
ncbi:hypothetical protein [Streptomyces sp. NPDC101234]|uniref:hypothetical protein n=1 Tax=Streptomyces sp. NPDC101234 TaxID=3366138 RepID=UPI00383087BA